jgi:hypothetical protein
LLVSMYSLSTIGTNGKCHAEAVSCSFSQLV